MASTATQRSVTCALKRCAPCATPTRPLPARVTLPCASLPCILYAMVHGARLGRRYPPISCICTVHMDYAHAPRYPADISNIDGYKVHDNPCGRCAGREGVRCGNKASRVVRGEDGLLLFCTAHFRQRAQETGVLMGNLRS